MDSHDNIEWLQNWMLEEYSGDHNAKGVKIEYIHHPQYGSWLVTIDTNDTDTLLPNVKETGEYLYDGDFYTYDVKNGIFNGNCDLTKLKLLIGKFRKVFETYVTKINTKISKEKTHSDTQSIFLKYSTLT